MKVKMFLKIEVIDILVRLITGKLGKAALYS